MRIRVGIGRDHRFVERLRSINGLPNQEVVHQSILVMVGDNEHKAKSGLTITMTIDSLNVLGV